MRTVVSVPAGGAGAGPSSDVAKGWTSFTIGCAAWTISAVTGAASGCAAAGGDPTWPTSAGL